MAAINTVKARAALKPRHPPYWHPLQKGWAVGFQKTSATAPGTWKARYVDEANTSTTKALPGISALLPSEQFDGAKVAAEEWLRHMSRGGSAKPLTVRGACESYVKYLRDEGRVKSADDAEARYRRWVYPSTRFAKTDLLRLNSKHVEAWRTALRKAPVIPQDKAKKPTLQRTDSTINRDMTALRAALNLALKNGEVTDDRAWRAKLKPVKNADRARYVYLTPDQQRALIAKAAPDLALFLRALSLLPLRPGAVAGLQVRNFNRQMQSIVIGKDKNGADRTIILPPATAALFSEQTKGKLPLAPIFARAGGKAWDKDAWKGPVREAVTAAKLPASITAYAMRHSTITDLVVVHKLPTLTVAQLSGTSVAMIERHYGHLASDAAVKALGELAL